MPTFWITRSGWNSNSTSGMLFLSKLWVDLAGDSERGCVVASRSGCQGGGALRPNAEVESRLQNPNFMGIFLNVSARR